MPTGKSKRVKKSSPVQQEVPGSSSSPAADEGPESELEAVEKTLEESLSYETLTWMRHIIRIQAEEVVKANLKQEKESNGAFVTKQLDDLKKKIHDIQLEVDTLKSENARQQREIERLEYTNCKK